MSDIVERLKFEIKNDSPLPGMMFVESEECIAEITRLRADKAALVEALTAYDSFVGQLDLECKSEDEAFALHIKASAALAQAKAGEP